MALTPPKMSEIWVFDMCDMRDMKLTSLTEPLRPREM